MRQIYTARDFTEAQTIKSRLQAEGVEAVVQGEYLSGVWGAIPISPSTSPSVWVVRDDDFDKATACLEEFSHSSYAGSGLTHWRCDRCGELIESQFTECWNCSTTQSDEAGVEAPEDATAEPHRDDSNVGTSELRAGDAAATQTPARTDAELWAETGLVLVVFLAPNLYDALTSLIWPHSYRVTSSLDWSLSYMVRDATYLALLVYLIWRSGEPWSAFGLVRPKWIVDPLVGVAFWAVALVGRRVCFMILSALIDLRSLKSSVVEEGWPSQAPTNFLEIAMFVVSVSLTAFCEELVMRAYLIPRFERLLGSSTRSVLLAAALFASFHVYQGARGTVNAFFLGIIFGALFCSYRCIWPIAIAHTIGNLLAFVSLFAGND